MLYSPNDSSDILITCVSESRGGGEGPEASISARTTLTLSLDKTVSKATTRRGFSSLTVFVVCVT